MPAVMFALCLSPGQAVWRPRRLPGEDLAAGGPPGALQGSGSRLPAPGPPYRPKHALVGCTPETGLAGPAPGQLGGVLHPDMASHLAGRDGPLQLGMAVPEPVQAQALPRVRGEYGQTAVVSPAPGPT